MEHKGIDCRYIANKIIIETNKTKDKNSLILTSVRLSKLVLLIDIAYMHKHKKMLIKNAYAWWSKGIALPNIYYSYRGTVGNPLLKEVAVLDNLTQKEYEQKLDVKLRNEINDIVENVLETTRYIDTLDLIDLLMVDIDEDEDTIIYKEEIWDIYKKFDFNKLKELNEKEKQEICGV